MNCLIESAWKRKKSALNPNISIYKNKTKKHQTVIWKTWAHTHTHTHTHTQWLSAAPWNNQNERSWIWWNRVQPSQYTHTHTHTHTHTEDCFCFYLKARCPMRAEIYFILPLYQNTSGSARGVACWRDFFNRNTLSHTHTHTHTHTAVFHSWVSEWIGLCSLKNMTCL